MPAGGGGNPRLPPTFLLKVSFPSEQKTTLGRVCVTETFRFQLRTPTSHKEGIR